MFNVRFIKAGLYLWCDVSNLWKPASGDKKFSISTQSCSSIPGPAGSAVEAANLFSFLKMPGATISNCKVWDKTREWMLCLQRSCVKVSALQVGVCIVRSDAAVLQAGFPCLSMKKCCIVTGWKRWFCT